MTMWVIPEYFCACKCLTQFEIFLMNIELTNSGARGLLTKGAISVVCPLIPGVLSAVDKTMEETFMRFAKSPGGLSGLFNMFESYQRFCCITSMHVQFFENMLEQCDLINALIVPKLDDIKNSRQERSGTVRPQSSKQLSPFTVSATPSLS